MHFRLQVAAVAQHADHDATASGDSLLLYEKRFCSEKRWDDAKSSHHCIHAPQLLEYVKTMEDYDK